MGNTKRDCLKIFLDFFLYLIKRYRKYLSVVNLFFSISSIEEIASIAEKLLINLLPIENIYIIYQFGSSILKYNTLRSLSTVLTLSFKNPQFKLISNFRGVLCFKLWIFKNRKFQNFFLTKCSTLTSYKPSKGSYC